MFTMHGGLALGEILQRCCSAHCPPSRCDTNDASLSLLLLLHVARKPFQTDTWAWHCFCFFTCEVRALHKYSGKEALLSLPSALGILGMALERASERRVSSAKSEKPAAAGRSSLGRSVGRAFHSPKCSHSKLYVTAEIASERASDRRRMNGLSFSFPTLPSPKYPSQIQPATAAALLVTATQEGMYSSLFKLSHLRIHDSE